MMRRTVSARLVCMVVVMALFVLGARFLHADDISLSREAIMRQHQQLARQHQVQGSASTDSSAWGQGGDNEALAPPLAAPLSPSGSSSPHAEAHAVAASSGGDLTTRLLERVNALEAQMRQMRGQLDGLTNKVQQDEADTGKKFDDMQFLLQNQSVSGHHRAVTPVAAQAVPSSSAAKVSSPKTAMQALRDGEAALKAHRYSEAETLAHQAAGMMRSASGKFQAQYLLARALAGQKQYRKSAVAYYDVYSKAPRSDLAPAALLGVASSMAGLGNRTEACEALTKLASEYPDASASVKTSMKSLRARAACH